MIIRARAPLRLGLAGGGTDVSPYCDLHGGCVLNATLDRYAYAVINPLNDGRLRFLATDQNVSYESSADDQDLTKNCSLQLHAAVYDRITREFNNGRPLSIELTTYCDAPAGSGLGSSSTLVVVMIKAFVELLNLPLDDYEIAKLAYEVERIDCNLKGGKQDQYAACFGGVNFMEFYAENQAVINPLRIKNWILCELEASLLLFYTGVSRESARIIADQTANIETGSQQAMDAMHGIKNEAIRMKEYLLKGDFKGVVSCMLSGWENKKRSALTVSNAHLDQIYSDAVSTGALAGKVSGAGGGGFMMFFVPPDKRMAVIHTLEKYNGQISNCHFTKHGTQAWKI